MKQNLKKSFLKLLLPGIFVLLMNPLLAQGPELCQDPCPAGALQSKIIELCKFNWVGTVNGNPQSLTNMPYVMVIINYRVRSCDDAIIIEDYVYIDDSDYWINDCFPPPLIVSPPVSPGPCSYQSGPIKDAIRDAIIQLVNDLHVSQTAMAVYFKGACYSLVHLSFPAGSFYTQQIDMPGGGTGLDTVWLSSNSNIAQRIPCNEDACCKVTFTSEIVTLDNGYTETRMRALHYESYGNCEQQPLPDYNSFPNKFEAKIWNPVTLMYDIVTGNVSSQDPCELTCPQFCPAWIPPPPTEAKPLANGILTNGAPLEFSVNPTLVDNFIRFTSNRPISKVVIYDMSGKMVLSTGRLSNGEIDASELKSGPHFVQVHFAGSEIRTVKVLKQ